jgi:hypothetical protein
VVDLLPDPDEPDLLARVQLVPGGRPVREEARAQPPCWSATRCAGASAPTRFRTGLVGALGRAAEAEGAMLRHVREDELVEVAVLLSGADAAEEQDPAYREELAAWVRDPTGVTACRPERSRARPAAAPRCGCATSP